MAFLNRKKFTHLSQNSYNDHKGVFMQVVTASEIKQNSTILQNALRDDMLVTKRDKPFVVVLDFKRYEELIAREKQQKNSNWIDDTFASMSEEESEDLLEVIKNNRINKETDIWS